MKSMSKMLHFSKSVMDNDWEMFIAMLKYKLAYLGKYLIRINRFFSSSKMCSKHNSIKKDLKLSDRVYKCDKCNSIIDRDYNATINIREERYRLYNNITDSSRLALT